jgi:hypothetical protein
LRADGFVVKHPSMLQQPNSTLRQGHGMALRLSALTLLHAPTASVARLAAWLGVSPHGPWSTPQDEAKAHRAAILRAEQRLAEGPPELRWVQKVAPLGPAVAMWPAPYAGASVKSNA